MSVPPRLPEPGVKPRVAVIGDLMLDRFVRGRAERLSPEAPVAVLAEEEILERPGGAANVAMNLAALGAEVEVVGLVGRDVEAEALRRLLGDAGLGLAGLIADPSRPTTVKTRIVARRQQIVRVDREQRLAAGAESAARLTAAAAGATERADAIVVSDYGKGSVTAEVWEAVRRAVRPGKALLVDPDPGADLGRYAGATLVKPNGSEAARAARRAGIEESEPARLAERLRAAAGLPALLLTRGDEGMILARAGEPTVLLPARRRDVFDVTGAGDTAMATLAWAVGAGQDLLGAAALANVAAGLAVERFGTAAVARAEIERALHPESERAEKVVPRAALAARVAELRAGGQRVVFTNGCFDLLHIGHLRLIRQCAAFGEAVVIGLNSDASVRRLKGEGRPILPAADRALLLAALPEVAVVTVFEEDTPAEVIAVVRPDVLVKGADYRPDQIVGRREVESWGGRLELVPLFEGVSTSDIVRRIRTGGGA